MSCKLLWLIFVDPNTQDHYFSLSTTEGNCLMYLKLIRSFNEGERFYNFRFKKFKLERN